MTTNYVAVTKLASVSGIPEDTFENVTAFTGAGVSESSDAVFIAAAMVDFFNTTGITEGSDVASKIGPQVSRVASACTVNVYKKATGGLLGSPILVSPWTMDVAGAGNSLPSEMACCLSFHSDLTGLLEESGTTRPRARHRGRIYIGPLNVSTSDLAMDATTKRASVAGSLRGALKDAATRLMNNTNVDWCVWSRTLDTFFPVTGGFIDDAFDVQRRRGEKAITRTTF